MPEKTMKTSHVTSSQPSARSGGTSRRPNCHGVGLPAVMRASSQAERISAPSWKKVPVIVTPGGGSPALTS
jgi:hypothetical protein